ncbi:MAG: N-acetyltransferase [Notoacmeibacter sp.]|nr:N-acetyltransferase [Notoacmeibacter sp.]
MDEIRREDGPAGGRLFMESGGSEAELTWRNGPEGRYLVTHTYTPPAMRGQGVALKLVEHMVEIARSEGRGIVPLCGYVAAQARNRPDWADVMG